MANVSRKPDVKLTHLAIHPCTSMHPYPRLLSEECIFTDTHPWTRRTIVSIHIPRPPTSESDVTDKRAQSRLWSAFRSCDPSTGSLQGPGLHALQVPCSPCSTWTHLRAVTCRSTCISLTRTNRLKRWDAAGLLMYSQHVCCEAPAGTLV